MARIIGTAPSSMKGTVGLYTYRYTKDGYIVSEKIKAKGVGQKTLRQCMVNMRIANLQHLFQSFGKSLEGSFENIPSNQNTQAAFMQANFSSVPVYLTKPAADFGACVVTPVQIARGTLPTIHVTQNEIPHTDIVLGTLTINANTTIAEFSQAVLANPGFENGDQLSFFSLIQGSRSFGDIQGIPVVTNNRYEVTLDKHDTEHKLYDIVGAYGFATVADGGVNYLGCSVAPAIGGYAWVHSRGFGADLRVSTQFIIANNNAVISDWTGEGPLVKAANSYGGFKNARFLEPGETSSSVVVEGGNDIQTGAVASGTFSVVSGSTTVNNGTANRTLLSAGQVTISMQGTNMQSYNQPVKLRMYSASNGTSYVDVTATKDDSASTSSNAVFKATVTAGNLYLGAVLVNGNPIKTFASTGGTVPSGGGNGDD